MNKGEVIDLMTAIDACYPGRIKLEKETLDIWHRLLKDQDFNDVMMKFDKYAKENKFPPTVADLYEKPRPERQTDIKAKMKEWSEKASGGKPERRG